MVKTELLSTLALSALSLGHGFTNVLVPGRQMSTSSQLVMKAESGSSRRDVIKTAFQGSLVFASTIGALSKDSILGMPSSSALADDFITTASGLKYEILEKGKGRKAEVGELVCVRFRAKFKEFTIDDLFKTAEPLFYRVGSGSLIAGADEAITLMSVGDRWHLVIPGSLAFGEKGRPSKPGSPRIPPGAEIEFEIFMESIPGKEEDLIELMDDDTIGATDNNAGKGVDAVRDSLYK